MPCGACFIHDPTHEIILGLRYDLSKMARLILAKHEIILVPRSSRLSNYLEATLILGNNLGQLFL